MEVVDRLATHLPSSDESLGSGLWKMSLREAWQQWIPVGGIYSGLFTAATDRNRRKLHECVHLT